MIETFPLTIPSLTGDRERRAFIYLPVDYFDGEENYPVIYMFDGQNLFDDEDATYGKSWGLGEYLDYTETPVIVASVECNTVGNGRLSEYSPYPFEFCGKRIAGRGKKYMDWLVGEFKPFIDENYRTLPDRSNTAIGGSSMGGLMTLYAVSAYNKYFSRGAALSPSLWVKNGDVPPFVKGANYGKDTLLYMDYGSLELKNHGAQKRAFAATCAALIEKRVNLTARIVEGGFHSEASWQNQIPYFMNAIGFTPRR